MVKKSDFRDPYHSWTYFHKSHPNSQQKRQKNEEEDGRTLEIDRISELPDSILVYILSLLPNTESAIRTGILSKRWQFVWTSIPVLSFSVHRDENTGDLDKFISVHRDENLGDLDKFMFFVDKTLIQCRGSKLKKFTIDVSTDGDGKSFPSLNAWIRYAVGCNVEELELRSAYTDEDEDYEVFKVPVYIFKNAFLTNLKLISCLMAPSGEISWKMLNKLSVWYSKLDNELFQNILSGSPMLQYLELGDCRDFTQLDVNSKSLQELVVEGYYAPFYDNDIRLKVSGPNILSLEIKGELVVNKLVLWNLPSLVKVTLDFYSEDDAMEDPGMWKEILENISHAKELSVGCVAIEVLSSLELDGWHSPLSKRTCLKMNFIRRSCFPGLANLLQSSPCLERLLINTSSKRWRYNGHHTRRNYLSYQRRSFVCLSQTLKFVKICYHVEQDLNHKCELGRFLLENACVLEKMIVNVRSDKEFSAQSVESALASQGILLQESQKYLSFSRASRKAVVAIEGHFRASPTS